VKQGVWVAFRPAGRGPVWRDLDGWEQDTGYVDDPRTAVLPAMRPGPWRDSHGRPARGIFARPCEDGLADWAAAVDGWMIWRWAGPAIAWRHELVSPWNLVLTRSRLLSGVPWRVRRHLPDPRRWIASALLAGRLSGGYVPIDHRRRTAGPLDVTDADRWFFQAQWAGLVTTDRFDGGSFVSVRGLLGEYFDLDYLARDYVRVLPPELGAQVRADLADAAERPVMSLMKWNDRPPPVVVRHLIAGYPPSVTAGHLISRHRTCGHPAAAEHGAYCPRCAVVATGRVPTRRSGAV
jgi:hypothetical protein